MPYKVLDPALATAAPVVTIGAPLVSVGDTFLDFQNELDLELGDRDDYDATRAKKWINWAYRHVAAMVDITELHAGFSIVTVASQYLYLLPKQVSFLTGVSVQDEENFGERGRAYTKIDLSTFRKLEDLDPTVPGYFFRHNRMLVIWPTAEDGGWPLAVDCKVRPDDMVNNTDSPLLPVEWHEGIQLFATHRGLRSLKSFKEAQVQLNNALESIRPMLDTDAEEKGTIKANVSPARFTRDLYRRGSSRRGWWRRGGL